ncbi:MAG: sulfatase-like hydrolase/transferase [Planctomycetota bacterium]
MTFWCLIRRAVVSLVVCAAGATAVEPERPNIVVIIADDMGYADLGVHGATDIKTKNLDRLASEGVTFSSGYVTHSFCAPSRAGFFAGRYQHRFGFEWNPHYDPANPHLGLPESEVTFVQRLNDAGYRTGGVGKWHLGAASPFNPLNRGFDYFYGFLGGGHDYFKIDLTAPVKTNYLGALVRNDQPAAFEGYLTDALSADAVQFIERESERDEPFFLYVGYNAPHAPLQATSDDLSHYRHIESWHRRTYAAMVHAMDRGVGHILDALEEAGERENTIVVFFSDNGGPVPNSWSGDGWWNGSSNEPLREGKAFVNQGGVRVPFLISWPDRLPKGAVYDEPVISLDVARTAVEVAGGDLSDGPTMDGINLVPFVTGEATSTPERALFWRQDNGAQWAVRKGDLVAVGSTREGVATSLYDLSVDIGETNDLSKERASDVLRLEQLFDEWNAGNMEFRFWNAGPYQQKLQEFYREGSGPEPMSD